MRADDATALAVSSVPAWSYRPQGGWYLGAPVLFFSLSDVTSNPPEEKPSLTRAARDNEGRKVNTERLALALISAGEYHTHLEILVAAETDASWRLAPPGRHLSLQRPTNKLEGRAR